MACKMAFWVQEDLPRKGVLPFLKAAEISHGELYVEKEMNKVDATETHHQSEHGQQEEEAKALDSCGFENSSHKLQDDVALVALLKACAKQKDLCKGSKVHADVLRNGLFTRHSGLSTSLLNMYARCGSFAKARQLFDELPMRDIFSWTALLAAYVEYGHGEEALNCFE
eukprot:c16915_g1_i1 orf=277-783(+)